MKNILFNLLLATAIFTACQNSPKTETPAATAPMSGAKPATATTCWEKRFGPDLEAIEMTVVGDEVSGFMAWEPDQKDGARGMFKGKKSGDLVTAIFEYMIEGSIQSEEVVFKIVGDKLMKGNGEMEDKAGIMTLKDKSKLTWEDVFSACDCAKIKEAIGRAVETHGYILKEQGKSN